MPSPRFLGELSSGVGEKNRAVGKRCDQSVALEALHRSSDRYVGHSQPPGQIDHASLAGCGNQFGNQLRVILCQFLRMLFTRAARIGLRGGRSGPPLLDLRLLHL